MGEEPGKHSVCITRGELLVAIGKDITALNTRMDVFETNCLRVQDEIKEHIDEALGNEYRHLKEKVEELESAFQANGMRVKKGFWATLLTKEAVLAAIISGIMGLLVRFWPA